MSNLLLEFTTYSVLYSEGVVTPTLMLLWLIRPTGAFVKLHEDSCVIGVETPLKADEHSPPQEEAGLMLKRV